MEVDQEVIETLFKEIGMLRQLNRRVRDALQANTARARVLALAHIEQSIRGGCKW